MLASITHSLKVIRAHELSTWRTYKRFVRWQLQSRIQGAMVASYVDGSRVRAAHGERGVSGITYLGLPDYEEMCFLGHLLGNGDHFVDVGANAGAYSLLAAARGAQVSSIEPVSSLATALRANVDLNGFSQVDIHQVAATDCSGEVIMTTGQDVLNHVVPKAESDQVDVVSGCRLDQLLSPATAIKVDVEGHELPAIRGSKALIEHKQMLAMVVECNETDRPSQSDWWPLLAIGWRAVRYDPKSRSLRLDDSITRSRNAIVVRSLPEVEQRLAKARSIAINGENI